MFNTELDCQAVGDSQEESQTRRDVRNPGAGPHLHFEKHHPISAFIISGWYNRSSTLVCSAISFPHRRE